MNYVTWEELEDITNIILDDVFEKTDFIYQSNWNFDGNIKHEYYPGIYENHFCNVPIEYQWTKWKILEWLQEAWEVLMSYEICNY